MHTMKTPNPKQKAMRAYTSKRLYRTPQTCQRVYRPYTLLLHCSVPFILVFFCPYWILLTHLGTHLFGLELAAWHVENWLAPGVGSRLSPEGGGGGVWEMDTCDRTYVWSSLSAFFF